MRTRTFLRVLFENLFHDNFIIRSVTSLVNFCNEYGIFNSDKLKYNRNIPLTKEDARRNLFFASITGDKIDCH